VGVALVIVGLVMVVRLRSAQIDDIKAAVDARADAVTQQIRADSAQDGLLKVGDDREDELAVVVGPAGHVKDSSRRDLTRDVVDRLSAALDGSSDGAPTVDDLPFEDDPFVLVQRPVDQGTLIVGRSLESVNDSIETLVGLLLVGLPVVLLVVGATTWQVVGRTLAPVEAIRAEVDAVSTKELHRRVPRPPGNDEISRLAATMNRMLGRLEQGQARQRRFVSDAAHELRSPIAAIRQHAEVVLSHGDGAASEELAGVVLEEDLRLQSLVEDLLMLSRMDEDGARPELDPVDLDDLLLEEAAHLRSATALRIDASGVSGGRVPGVSAQLSRLVRNLADNAARHARTTVGLSLSENGNHTILRIDDDGPGIPPAARERVFGRFVRLDESRDRGSGGAGLGLAIVAEVAARHGGAVVVGDSPLGGARFEVRLPRLHD
jgi:signal transduction histidine kinase